MKKSTLPFEFTAQNPTRANWSGRDMTHVCSFFACDKLLIRREVVGEDLIVNIDQSVDLPVYSGWNLWRKGEKQDYHITLPLRCYVWTLLIKLCIFLMLMQVKITNYFYLALLVKITLKIMTSIRGMQLLPFHKDLLASSIREDFCHMLGAVSSLFN